MQAPTQAKVYRLSHFPVQITLPDGTAVTVRPMVPQDEAALLRFFQSLPEEDRFYLREDVTFPEVIAQWASTLDYDRVLPLLAFVNDEVVADATLHRHRPGARKHIAEARLTVAPAYRGRGLGAALLKEILAIAYNAELDRVVMELVADCQPDAEEAARQLGFIEVARLPCHARDRNHHPRDLVVFDIPLGKWYEWSQE